MTSFAQPIKQKRYRSLKVGVIIVGTSRYRDTLRIVAGPVSLVMDLRITLTDTGELLTLVLMDIYVILMI